MGSSGYVEIEYVREFAGGLTNVDAHFCQCGGTAAGRRLARGCVVVDGQLPKVCAADG